MNRLCHAVSGLFLLFALHTQAATLTVNDSGDAGPGDCSSKCTLRDAIGASASGGTVAFAPGLVSPITLSQGALSIDKALTIQGPGAAALTVSAQNTSRVFNIAAAATISALEIADGAVTGGNGSDGNGGAGESAGGACVLVANGGVAVLDRVAVRHCHATGGNGGSGSAGSPGSVLPPPTPGGAGGSGGSGGAATGAAIEVNGSLTLLDSSVVDAHGTGGIGGIGGMGGIGIPPGFSGLGGIGGEADGGAVFVGNGASLRITNSTIAESGGTGGGGGLGGFGPAPAPGGSGGFATGGLLYVDAGATLADVEFSTLANGSVAGGPGGAGAFVGADGIPSGNAINAGSTLTVLSSIVVGAQSGVTVCYGSVTAAPGSVNLSEDTSCSGFTQATFAQTLLALDVTTTPWPGYMPVLHGPAIDAASTCQDLAAQPVTSDQHGIARPQGAACDVGAIEADYIFVDGFGN